MSIAPLTPGEDASPADDVMPQSQPVVDFSPATVPYNEAFENELMNAILHSPTNPSAPTSNHETPVVPASQLPIPLSSNLRTHHSPIPGLNLTHANGYHTGGPGPSPETLTAFRDKFMRDHQIETPEQFQDAIQAAMAEKMAEARERMEEREKAVLKNREIDEELEKLRLQREQEVRVLEKMKGKR
ncbi:hypothetical protein EK21DRAFT_67961 [Setomelanomma holmii]|uniref:Uncharacterized protein n=1 Tax=Setomelanomma holmii TaxID=210430 RepID=A0A9P4H7Z0_9PLEO|nr:hypothetical protein EK21DRAFT_67961 [Setomelanomma holmii]